MLMFNFRMQREVAENHVFKRVWLEPAVKCKLAKCNAPAKSSHSEQGISLSNSVPTGHRTTQTYGREICFTSVEGGSQTTKKIIFSPLLF